MHALSVKDLVKTYRTGTKALRGISLDIEQGDFFALLGPNGAGKTTLIGILTSLVNKTSGHIEIFGHDIDSDFSAAKSCIGVVPQEFNISVFDRVHHIVLDQAGYYGIPRKIAKIRAEKYLKQLDLWDKRNEISRFLSGGMKRRLMIARALIHEPKMLVLDEPTAGVDVELRRSSWDFLKSVNEEGVTIILTTHYLEEAETNCRNIAIINHGKIIENTSMSNLLKQLDVESFILYLNKPLHVTPELQDCKVKLIDQTTLEIEVSKNIGVGIIFSQLQSKGIEIASLRNKSNRLEELFITLTSREASE